MLQEAPVLRGHWPFGSARDALPNVHRFVADGAVRHGGLFRFRAMHRTLYATVRPSDFRHILFDNVDNYVKSYHYSASAQVSGRGILFNDGESWRDRRRQIQPGFKRLSLRPIAEIAARECSDVVDGWTAASGGGDPVDVVAEMRTIALRTITRALLGIGLDNGNAEQFGNAVAKALSVIGKRNNGLPFPLWMPTPANQALHDTKRVLDEFLLEQVRTRRAALAAGEETPGGIIESYVNNEQLTEQDALDETKTLFTAGFETAATALSWMLGLLAVHRDIADACHEEVDHVLGGRLPTADDLSQLPKLTAVCEETLRLYPPITQIGRLSLAEDALGQYRLPKGATILISMYGIQRSPEFWDEPDAFKPDRFAPGRRDAIPDLAFMPFGAGRRTCIGNHFAMQEQVSVLATILQRFRLEMAPGADLRETLRVTLQPGANLLIQPTPRGAS